MRRPPGAARRHAPHRELRSPRPGPDRGQFDGAPHEEDPGCGTLADRPMPPPDGRPSREASKRHTNPILKAMVRSPRTAPWVPRRPQHGRTRWQAARPREGEVLAADGPSAPAERPDRPRLLPARGPEGLDLPLVAPGVDPPRPAPSGRVTGRAGRCNPGVPAGACRRRGGRLVPASTRDRDRAAGRSDRAGAARLRPADPR